MKKIILLFAVAMFLNMQSAFATCPLNPEAGSACQIASSSLIKNMPKPSNHFPFEKKEYKNNSEIKIIPAKQDENIMKPMTGIYNNIFGPFWGIGN